MQAILIATVVVAVIGLLVGVMLVSVGKKFEVKVDPREAAVRECLPGNNCGGCGFAGCDALAGAIVAGDAPANACPVGGAPVGDKIASIMGVDAGDAERKVAFVRCAGDCEHKLQKSNYVGIQNCEAVFASGLNPYGCNYGCLGFGACVKVCPFGAISVKNNVAVVDRAKCKACGKCVAVCPKKLIELVPEKVVYAVRCSNREKGPIVKQSCTAGCIGCGICAKQCENEAVRVEGNISRIDYEKCVSCGKCAAKCPVKVIVDPHTIR